ncbi:signal peptidase I [Labrenzia sp. DG1229]|uniref:signal peptidase I n=1 Tax=Labrenzia sp. DG1229 TaxID=681847 RepID=UPI001AD8A234|nr:signal peptidase I [Labrenzia sp. DG1229]
MKLKLFSFGMPFLLGFAVAGGEIGNAWLGDTASRMKSFSSSSGSMLPTLEIGDRFLVRLPIAEFYRDLARSYSPEYLPNFRVHQGDIVVFKLPSDFTIVYVKRVVGLPGDTIQVLDGVVHIDGKPIKRERIDDYIGMSSSGAVRHVPRFRETLPNGVSYETLDLTKQGQLDNTREYKVPPGHYFMMGDNRDNSVDSRVLTRVGFVPAENLIGRATTVYVSGTTNDVVWRSLKPHLND